MTISDRHTARFLLGPGFCAGIGTGLIFGLIMYFTSSAAQRPAGLRDTPPAGITAPA